MKTIAAAVVILGAGSTWDFAGEAFSPATLKDCPGAVMTISTNGGAYSPWRRFCYYGGKK